MGKVQIQFGIAFLDIQSIIIKWRIFSMSHIFRKKRTFRRTSPNFFMLVSCLAYRVNIFKWIWVLRNIQRQKLFS